MKPLKQYVLIEEIEEPHPSGLIIVEKKIIKKGRVLRIGSDVQRGGNPMQVGYGIGSAVYFIDPSPSRKTREPFLIHDKDIIGIDDELELDDGNKISSLFQLPEWDTFKGEDSEYRRWKDFENLRQFKFGIQFMKHIMSRDVLSRIIYEHCCHQLRNHNVGLQYININQPDDTKPPQVTVDYDAYSYTFTLYDDGLEIQKSNSSLQSLISTLPVIMRICASILDSPEFKQVLGRNANRAFMTNTTINQTIRLAGKGSRYKDSVRNWEVMQKLLRIESEDEKGKKTLFGLLGAESKSLGRTDILFSFEKSVNGHLYSIFLSLSAPANEQNTLIDVQWNIQDQLPGMVSDRDYSKLLTVFFRDIVLNSFYLKWFENINCTTVGN